MLLTSHHCSELVCFILLFSYAAGNFQSVTNKWSSGDKLSLELPVNLRTEAIEGIYPSSLR